MNESQPRFQKEPQRRKPTYTVELAVSTWEAFQTLPSSMEIGLLMRGRRISDDPKIEPWRKYISSLEDKDRRAVRSILDRVARIEGIRTLAQLADPDLNVREDGRRKGFNFTIEHEKFLKIGFQGENPANFS